MGILDSIAVDSTWGKSLEGGGWDVVGLGN